MFSIVVLTCNRSALLKDCLLSLLSQRDGGEYEVIVADDGSQDDTRDVVGSLQGLHENLRYCFQKNRGVAAARNLGLRHARGDLIAFSADDYLFPPDYIARAREVVHEYPQADIVRFRIVAAGCTLGDEVIDYYYQLGILGRLMPVLNDADGAFAMLRRRLHQIVEVNQQATFDHRLEAAGAAVFHRRVFERVGSFDVRFFRSEDSDMAEKVRAEGLRILHYPLLEVRHRFEQFPLEAVHKSFRSGYHRRQLYLRHGSGVSSRGPDITARMVDKAALAITSIREKPLRSVYLLPGMLLLEAANKAGYLWHFLQHRSLNAEPAADVNSESLSSLPRTKKT
jgi:glycosyltransferase involved in cell wall biosynthesis